MHCTVLHYIPIHPTNMMHCTALHCSAQYCTYALYCTELPCTALEFTTVAAVCQQAFSWETARGSAVHCTALHCTALNCTVLHCTALQCTALHFTTLLYNIFHKHVVSSGCLSCMAGWQGWNTEPREEISRLLIQTDLARWTNSWLNTANYTLFGLMSSPVLL